MPSKYDPAGALPLRVPPALREALDALVGRLPPTLPLPRNTVAVVALARGVAQLGAELARDPLAVHRAVAGEHAPSVVGALPDGAPTATGLPSTAADGGAPVEGDAAESRGRPGGRRAGAAGDAVGAPAEHAPTTPGAAPERGRSTAGARRGRAPTTDGARSGGAPLAAAVATLPEGVTRADVLARLLDALQNGRASVRGLCREAGVARSRVQAWVSGDGQVSDATAARVHAWLELQPRVDGA